MNAVRAYAQLLAQAPRAQVALLLALMLLAGLTEGCGLLLLVPLLELLQHGTAGAPSAPVRGLVEGLRLLGLPLSVAGVLGAFMLLTALRCAVLAARERAGVALQHALVDGLRQRCFAALLAAEWRWVAGGRQAHLASLLLTDVNRVGAGLHHGLGLLATLALLGAGLVVAFVLSWPVTALALCSGLLVLGLMASRRRDAQRLGRQLGEAYGTLQATVQESLAGLKLAKMTGGEPRHLERFARATAALRRQQLDFVAGNSRAQATFQLGGAALLALYLYAGLVLWPTPLAQLLTLVLVFARLIPMFSTLQQQTHQLLHALPALQQAQALLAQCRAAAEPPAPPGTAPWPVREAIELRAATVRHDGRQRPALDAVSLRLPVRTTTAVMGASASGKSTLADVLAGLVAPDGGELLVDGQAVSGARRRCWRRSVAYVPQEVFLFNDSIRANLLWARPTAGEAELRLALQRAAADFALALPQGLDTVVGDGGMRLSGGERQRLALARALLQQPSLLILDEATSALDTDNEARVRQAIEQLHGDLTVLLIGHRLPTLEHADHVVVMEGGRIHAQGRWSDVRGPQPALP